MGVKLPRLKLSLAAKCRLLFGAAVILIIAAALFVPWQRMEQLTEQLDEGAASAVATAAVAEHILSQEAAHSFASTAPATRPSTTQPAMKLTDDAVIPVRLIPVSALQEADQLTRFEASALRRFTVNPDLKQFARKDPSTGRFRYARPLAPMNACINCHAVPTTMASIAGKPTTQPSPILGMVSVDIATQISAGQLLLNRVFILTAGMIAGSLAIIIFYLVTTRFILQPVRVLQETAEKVSQGDLNIRSDINTGDEFQVLSETFNTMLANLKQSADQLRAVNKSLDLKLGQLAESNVALFESNRLKSEFLANVSHELRTPLNSILGFADLLKEQSQLGPDQKGSRYVQNILTSGHNLLDLINDLLDLAKIEAGRMEVRPQELSLQDLFETLVNVLKPLTEAKALTIVPDIAPDVPIMQTDGPKLQQILYNFLSNAIKFSPASGQIELMARKHDLGVRISVVDHGPGIDPAQHAMIFEKFRQIDGSVTRQHSGTGLGLAISSELTGLLGGTIGVQSTPGDGATFHVTLPLKIEAAHADMRGRISLS